MNNIMNSNPVFMLMNVMRNGGNPQTLLQQMAQNNPQMGSFLKMIDGKNPQQLKTMAENMCKERGVTPQQLAQQLGINIPNN